jgi:hypothetical protein
MYINNNCDFDYTDNNKFMIIKIKNGKYRLYEYESIQASSGGGSVVNGTYDITTNVLRDLSGKIINFDNKLEANKYADKII